MKQNDTSRNKVKEEGYFLVPQSLLLEITESNKRILALLENKNQGPIENSLGNFISESEAKQRLDKKTTWFWNMRKSGKLAFSKVGGTNYYDKNDLIKLLEQNKVEE